MARMLKEPQSDKQVWWVNICPKHESILSPFSSLTEPCCTNCIYSEATEKDNNMLNATYCRYPTKRDK